MTEGAYLTNSKGLPSPQGNAMNRFGRVQLAVGSDAGSGHITLNSPTFKEGKTISLENGLVNIS
jgi:hypothetical protein